MRITSSTSNAFPPTIPAQQVVTVGLYIPSGIVEKLFPSINHTRELNPSVFLTAHVSSHDCPDSEAGAIYYNSRHFGKTRNEKGLPAGVEAAHFRILKIQGL